MAEGPQPSHDYRVYALSPAGSILHQAYFQADDDAQAVAWAEAWQETGRCELWQGHRKVIMIEIV